MIKVLGWILAIPILVLNVYFYWSVDKHVKTMVGLAYFTGCLDGTRQYTKVNKLKYTGSIENIQMCSDSAVEHVESLK